MKAFVFFLLLLIFAGVYGQETTKGKAPQNHSKEEALEPRNILIVPFEKNMYRSDTDLEIAKASGISVYELRTLLREELHRYLEKALTGKKSAYNLLNENPYFKRDYDYLNYSTAYKYESLDGINDNENSGTKNGQIIGNAQSGNRFMNRIFSNPKSLEIIHKKYGTEHLIFINQMDIGPAENSSQLSIMNETFQREIKVHYTIFHYSGKEIASGIALAQFPSKTKKANVIITEAFPKIAQDIISKLP